MAFGRNRVAHCSARRLARAGGRFVAGLGLREVAVSSHSLEALVTPTIEAPMMAAYSYRDVCEHVALHNAHHLDQVILLRQMMDAWRPPAGSYTWL